MNNFPQSIKSALWSYDPSQLDISRDSERIITNVLNFGTRPATDWLFSAYSRDQIKNVVSSPMPGEWNKKSLNFWATVFNVESQTRTRF